MGSSITFIVSWILTKKLLSFLTGSCGISPDFAGFPDVSDVSVRRELERLSDEVPTICGFVLCTSNEIGLRSLEQSSDFYEILRVLRGSQWRGVTITGFPEFTTPLVLWLC